MKNNTLKKVKYHYAVEYTGSGKMIAKMVKGGSFLCLFQGVELLHSILPPEAILIPIPSHTGKATYTLDLCNILASRYGYTVHNCLASEPRESICELKKEGKPLPSPSELGFYKVYEPPKGKPLCLIDNVIATGTTAVAACELFNGEAEIYCIASDETISKIEPIEH